MKKLYSNQYLFSEIYLDEITQTAEEPEVVASLSTLKDFLEYADTSSISSWDKSFIYEVLLSLRFSPRLADEHTALLYPLGEKEKLLSVVYTLLPSENLNNEICSTGSLQPWHEFTYRLNPAPVSSGYVVSFV
jgi:hypothetical protein